MKPKRLIAMINGPKSISSDREFEFAEYALVDFNSKEIWIYVQDDIPSLLIPATDTYAVDSFSHKMLNFSFATYQVNGGAFETYLLISPPSKELSEVFLSFIRSILEEIGAESKIESVVNLIIQKYEEWSEFFGTGKLGPDSTSKIVGLIGELLVLNEFVIRNGPQVIANWWGPTRHRHDFEFEKCAVEVKTTTNPLSKEIAIHGLRQLEVDPNKTLFLAHLKLSLNPIGENLAALINRLTAAKVSEFELKEKVEKSGISKEIMEDSDKFTFNGFGVKYYSVDTYFPSITSANFDPGKEARISKVNYSILIDGLIGNSECPIIQ
jgi:hypothetical protein